MKPLQSMVTTISGFRRFISEVAVLSRLHNFTKCGMSSVIPITDKSSPWKTEVSPFERIDSPPIPTYSTARSFLSAIFRAPIKFEPKMSPENSPVTRNILSLACSFISVPQFDLDVVSHKCEFKLPLDIPHARNNRPTFLWIVGMKRFDDNMRKNLIGKHGI